MGEGEEGRYSAPQAYGPVRLWLDRGTTGVPSLRLLALMLRRPMAGRSESAEKPHPLARAVRRNPGKQERPTGGGRPGMKSSSEGAVKGPGSPCFE